MTRQAIAMIINFGKEDIHEYKYNFPEGECIANVTVQKSETWEKSIRKTASLLKDSLGLFRKIENVFLWTKTEIYSSPSKLKQKKHIWNSQRLSWLVKEQCILFTHTNEKGEMYSAIAQIDTKQLDCCLNYIRTHNDSFLFAADKKNINWNDIDYFLSCFYFDFEKVVDFLYNQGFLFIRIFGNFDDQNLSVDFLGKEEMISNFFRGNSMFE